MKSEKTKTALIVTQGCRLNTADTALLTARLRRIGWEVVEEEDAVSHPELVVVNSCAVTAEAERKCRQTLRRLRRPRCEYQRTIFAFVQLPEPGLQIAANRLDLMSGIEWLKLQFAAETGRSDHSIGSKRIFSFWQDKNIPRVFSGRKAEKRQLIRQLHGHILQTVYSEIGAMIPQGKIKLLHEQAFAADLIQSPVQDPVSGRLHGEQIDLPIRIGIPKIIHKGHTLYHGKTAVPAADGNLPFHPNIFLTASRVCSRSASECAADRNIASNWEGAR